MHVESCDHFGIRSHVCQLGDSEIWLAQPGSRGAGSCLFVRSQSLFYVVLYCIVFEARKRMERTYHVQRIEPNIESNSRAQAVVNSGANDQASSGFQVVPQSRRGRFVFGDFAIKRDVAFIDDDRCGCHV